jgi:hypothetical protein
MNFNKVPIIGQVDKADYRAEVERLAKHIGVAIPPGTPELFWALPLLIGLTVRLQNVCRVIDKQAAELAELKSRLPDK